MNFSTSYKHPELKSALETSRERLSLLRSSLGNLDLTSIPENLLEELRRVLVEETVGKARDDLYTFVRLLSPILIPEGFKDGVHIKFMCEELMQIERSVILSQEANGNIPPIREQFSLPPGGMKSMLISKFFVAWCLGRHPTWNVMQLGHSTDFARDNFGRKVKELILSEEYRMIFPGTIIKSDARAADRFELTEGGIYFCTGAGSAITGRRAHLLICDDVLTEHTAFSEKERKTINEWYVPGARSRLFPFGAEIMVATRWNLDDLLGYIQNIDKDSSRPWKLVRIPAIIDKPSSQLLGLPIGSSFWPELWPLKVLLEKKEAHTPAQWASLFMQNPIPEQGAMIKAEWIKWWDPKIHGNMKVDYIVVSIDTAFGGKSKDADYNAFTIWGVFSTNETGYNSVKYDKRQLILLGARKGRWGFPELMNEIKEVNKEYSPDLFIVEKKGSGISVIQELKLRDYPIYEYQPDKDKKARVYASTGTFHAGQVWFPADRQWARDVLQELVTFPYFTHDDYVDTTTQMIIWMRSQYQLSGQGEIGYNEDEEEDKKVEYTKVNSSYWDEALA